MEVGRSERRVEGQGAIERVDRLLRRASHHVSEVKPGFAQRIPNFRIVGIAAARLFQRCELAQPMCPVPDVEGIVGCGLERVGSYQEAVPRRQPVIEAAGPERQRASALSRPALRQPDAAEREGEARVTLHRDLICRDRRVE